MLSQKSKKSNSVSLPWYKNKIFWLAGIVIVVYINTLWNDYNYDDVFITTIQTQNKGIKALSDIFTSHYWQQKENTFGYRPIVRASYLIEQQLWGNNAAMSHALNLLFYLLTVMLLYGLLKKLFPENEVLVWWVCVLFAVHPLHTEVVGSLKNREDLFAMLFGLLAIQFAFTYFIRHKSSYVVYSILSATLATLSKESGIVFLALIPLTLCTYYRAEFISFIKRHDFWIFLLILALCLWIILQLPKWVLPPEDKIVYFFENPLHQFYSLSAKIAMSLVTIGFYIVKLIIPFPLLFYYGYNVISFSGNILYVIVTLLTLAGTVIVCWNYRKKNFPLLFGTFWFWISLLPFSNYFIPINGIVGERLAYIASAGFIFAMLSLLFRMKNKKIRLRFLTLVLIIFSVMTIQRNSQWKNINTLFYADMPYLENSAKANASFATLLLNNINQRSKTEKISFTSIDSVLRYYKRSVEIYPYYYSSMNNMGLLYMNYFANDSMARYWFNKALEIKENYAEAFYNLGKLYLRNHDSLLALHQFNMAVKYDSLNIYMLNDLANLYFSFHQQDSAWLINKKIEQIDSTSDIPYINYGNYALMLHDTVSAVKYWEIAIVKHPVNPSLVNGLYHYFIQHGNSSKGQYYQTLLYELQKKTH